MQFLFVLFSLTVLIFILLKTMPGDPARVMAGVGPTQATIEQIRADLGLDRPLLVQYWRLVSGLFDGRLKAITYHKTVWSVILDRLPATLEVGFFAMAIVMIIAIPAGLLSAVHRGSLVDYGVTTIALLGISVPVFWFGLMLMLLFGVILKVLPVCGRGSVVWGLSFLTLDGLRHLIIPAITLASVQIAMNVRLLRSNMLEVMYREFINTARAKGLSEGKVIVKHALRNALSPMVTNIGMELRSLYAGAVLTETVTAWPGIGRLMYDAIIRQDEAVVFGLSLFVAATSLISYLVVDLLYVYIDPRISYD